MPSPLTIACGSCGTSGVVGTPYTCSLAASGGTPPYVFSLNGKLPLGLKFDPATGIISGTPIEPGASTVAISVTDSLGNVASTITTQQLAPNTNKGYDFGYNPMGDFIFEHGGSLYAFMVQAGQGDPSTTGDFHIHVLKSANSGDTWTDLGAGPKIDPASSINGSFTVGVDGATAIVITVIAGCHAFDCAITGVQVSTFDFHAENWAGSATHNEITLGRWDNPPLTGSQGDVFLQLIVRGPSDYIFYYNGAPASSGYGKVYYCLFDGLAFGPAVALPGQDDTGDGYLGVGAVYDNVSRNTQFFYVDHYKILTNVGMSFLGVMGGAQNVSENLNISTSGSLSPPQLYTDGGANQVGIAVWEFVRGVGAQYALTFYSAPLNVRDLVWQSSLANALVDDTDIHSVTTTDGPYQASASGIPSRTFTLLPLLGAVRILWSVAVANIDTGGWIGEVWYTQADLGTLTWSAPARLFRSMWPGTAVSPTNQYEAGIVQLVSIPISGGGFVVIGASVDASLAEAGDLGASAPATCTLEVTGGVEVSCASLPGGQVGQPYSAPAVASGGAPPYAWIIISGSLPPGLTLDRATGTVSGTPTTPGAFSFRIGVGDSSS